MSKKKGGAVPDPEIEVDLESKEEGKGKEETPEDMPVCVQSDDRALDCAICDYTGPCESRFVPKPETRTEPVTYDVALPLAIDGDVIPPLDDRIGQVITEQIYRDRLDQAKLGIVRHIERNPTKSLEMCVGAFIYARLVMVPKALLALETIQLISEVLVAYRELTEGGTGITVREVTPPGTRIN